MEYAVSLTVVAVFIAVYLLTRPKVRTVFFDEYDDLQFVFAVESFIKEMPLPKEGGKTDAKRYASTVKRVMFKIKSSKFGSFFEKFIALEDDIKKIIKYDFALLDELPSIEKEPRAVKIARFCLVHSDYRMCDARIKRVFEEQNKRRTLSYSEIMAMGKAFRYILTEKICYIYLQLETLAKVYDLAAKYVYNPLMISGKYKKLIKSRLFLSLCALRAGYRMEYFSRIHCEVTDGLYNKLTEIIDAIKEAEKYDFSVFYTPLEILDRYETFSSATAQTKQNFLALIKEASDKENLDEFMYTIRVDKYMQSASSGHISVRRGSVFSRTICVINQKRDISMLAAALNSRQFMNLYFAPNERKSKRNGKSISKIIEYENTFEPICKFRTLNFGISVSGGKLKVSPSLPAMIERADVVFDVNGTQNSLHIERGEEKALYLGTTRLSGIEQIKLGEVPVDVTVTVPRG